MSRRDAGFWIAMRADARFAWRGDADSGHALAKA
jgi:hypothetical protein